MAQTQKITLTGHQLAVISDNDLYPDDKPTECEYTIETTNLTGVVAVHFDGTDAGPMLVGADGSTFNLDD